MRTFQEDIVGTLKSRVLIIDDDPGLTLTLSAILSKAGYSVTAANSGLEGLEAFRSSLDPDTLQVVLLDIRMPDMNGVQVLKELKKIAPGVGVIMITGNADLESAVDSLHEG